MEEEEEEEEDVSLGVIMTNTEIFHIFHIISSENGDTLEVLHKISDNTVGENHY
jgi:hypothetical protein